jgi:hypothetical protein
MDGFALEPGFVGRSEEGCALVFALRVVEKRGWDIAPIWAERFALAVLATVFVGAVILNIPENGLDTKNGAWNEFSLTPAGTNLPGQAPPLCG